MLREQLRPDVVFLNTGLWKTIEYVCEGIYIIYNSLRMLCCRCTDQPAHMPHPTHITTKTHSPGAPLAELVAAAKDLHQTSSVEVFWKTTTSRAAGAVWVR